MSWNPVCEITSPQVSNCDPSFFLSMLITQGCCENFWRGGWCLLVLFLFTILTVLFLTFLQVRGGCFNADMCASSLNARRTDGFISCSMLCISADCWWAKACSHVILLARWQIKWSNAMPFETVIGLLRNPFGLHATGMSFNTLVSVWIVVFRFVVMRFIFILNFLDSTGWHTQ